jgi:hypothetical protein
MEVHAKLIGRPSRFNGNEAAWADWLFQTRAYLEVMDTDISDALGLVDAATDEIQSQRLSAENKGAAHNVFYILAQLLRGPALLELRRVERGNGLERWRLLSARYEKGATSRLAATLQSILRPPSFPGDVP